MHPFVSPSRRHAVKVAALVMAGAFSLGGCAGPGKPLIYVDPTVASHGYTFVVIADVTKGSTEIPAELLERTGRRLRQQLTERGFSIGLDEASSDTQEFLLVKATMQKY